MAESTKSSSPQKVMVRLLSDVTDIICRMLLIKFVQDCEIFQVLTILLENEKSSSARTCIFMPLFKLAINSKQIDVIG